MKKNIPLPLGLHKKKKGKKYKMMGWWKEWAGDNIVDIRGGIVEDGESG